MKKALKIIAITIIVLLTVLIATPILFKGKIMATLKEKINENINAKFDFNEANISFIRNFPYASVSLENVSVVNFTPFKGDTLFRSKEIKLKTSITDLIKGNINVKHFALNDSKVNLIVNKNGKANFDIAKPGNEKIEKTKEKESTAINIAVDSYEINNLDISYNDKKGNILFKLTALNHSGSGDLSSDRTKLVTKSNANVHFKTGKTSLVDNLHIDLDATLDLDLKNKKFSFLKNKVHINRLPLVFEGFVKLNEKNQKIKLDFKTPSTNFKNFLALVPKAYAKNTEAVTTTGNFEINGKIDGIVDKKHIPKININILSNNASFKFPNLPKGVKNIKINTNINNKTGLLKDMAVDVRKFAFRIDDNIFSATSSIRNLTTNPYVKANFKGKLNLEDIKKVYPLDKEIKLQGIINANLSTEFDAQAIQKSIPERIKNNGTISLSTFAFDSKEMNHPLTIKNAEINFKPSIITLTNFEAKTGESDIKANGTLEDVIAFVLANKKLKGNFNLSSNTFKVLDFMQTNTKQTTKTEPTTETKTVQTGELKIPNFLDITTNVKAKKVIYDNLTLSNVSGAMIIKEQKATLKKLNANMFDGKIGFDGSIDTKEKTPLFDMKLDIKGFNIASSFTSMKMLQKLAPISDIISGKFNTSLNLKGKLTKELTPDLNTLGGNGLAELLGHTIDPTKSKTMSLLNKNFSFINLKQLNLKDLKANLSFKDGKVSVKPMDLKYKDIGINIGGSHGFDQQMDYNVKLDIPAKYLGPEVSKLINKLGNKNKNIKIPVTANLAGTFSKPSVKTNMKSAISNLTSTLIEQQKAELKNKALNLAKSKIKNKEVNTVLKNVLGSKNDRKKNTEKVKKKLKDKAKEEVKKKLGKTLGGLFGS